MSTDKPNPEIERELLVSYARNVKIEEVEGKPVARLSFPPSMQGHTFEMSLKETSASWEPTGPFRIEYVLGTEFAIHEDEAPLCTFEAGYSHLAMTPELGRLDKHGQRLLYLFGELRRLAHYLPAHLIAIPRGFEHRKPSAGNVHMEGSYYVFKHLGTSRLHSPLM
jgi:hypothetical protein